MGTAFAVYEAVQKNKPLIERIVTVTGRCLARPSNLRVRIGTPIASLIEYCGGFPEDAGKVVGGGPMMGRAIANLDAPVTKGTSGILLIREKGAVRKMPQRCIKCAKCVSICTMGLEPYPVSYTHLDVYKRQHLRRYFPALRRPCNFRFPFRYYLVA